MMPMLAFVLRLVLCIALVLNGMGEVLAATRMQVAGGAGHEAPVVVETASPCHGPSGEAVPLQPDGHGAHGSRGGPDSHATDCCSSQGAVCGCECVHASHVVLPPSAAGGMTIPALPGPAHLATGHIAPALPDPIRPPIG